PGRQRPNRTPDASWGTDLGEIGDVGLSIRRARFGLQHGPAPNGLRNRQGPRPLRAVEVGANYDRARNRPSVASTRSADLCSGPLQAMRYSVWAFGLRCQAPIGTSGVSCYAAASPCQLGQRTRLGRSSTQVSRSLPISSEMSCSSFAEYSAMR